MTCGFIGILYNEGMSILSFFLGFFAVVSVIHITAIILRKEWLRRISKCFIIPPLLGAYIAGAGNWIIFPIPALILGWIGDVLLIRIDKKSHFITGLASFLLGHFFYIVTFACILGFFGYGAAGPNGISMVCNINVPALLIFIVPTVFLGMVVFRLIKPTKEMYGPVLVYMVILIMMSFAGFQVFLFHPGIAGLLILSGSFNFMISDTILAYYTFRKLKLSGAVLIMAYYILAQAEIIIGLLLLNGTVLI